MFERPSRVEMLHIVDENKLSFNKHIHQYHLNIDECNMQSDLFSCMLSVHSALKA